MSTVTGPSPRNTRIRELFAAVDSMKFEEFGAFLTDEVTFVMGNNPPLHGRDAVREGSQAFMASIASIHHTIDDWFERGPEVLVRVRVTVGRRDGEQVTVPAVVHFEERDAGITRYQIYVDMGPVFA